MSVYMPVDDNSNVSFINNINNRDKYQIFINLQIYGTACYKEEKTPKNGMLWSY